MLPKGLLIIAALGPIFASPSTRADICFQYGTGGGIIVAKGASLPAPNTCLPVALVEQVEGGRIGIATGSICTGDTGSSATTLVYQYTYDACAGPGGYFESATCRIDINGSSFGGGIDLPSKPTPQISSCNGVYADPESGQSASLTQFTDQTLKAWKCDMPYVPGGGSTPQCIGFARRRGGTTPK
jgi:hypothetical protein